MDYLVEFTKFCDPKEILIADEFWSFISDEPNTMQEILNIIRDIATPSFMEEFQFVCNPSNLTAKTAQYFDIVSKWHLIDESSFATNITKIASSSDKKVIRSLNTCAFSAKGEYNEHRSSLLKSII